MSWQQQLVPPGPTRRLRHSGTAWWGIDPSTKRLSVAVATVDTIDAYTRSFMGGTAPQQLDLIHSDTAEHVRDVLLQRPAGEFPALVVIEQPSGTVRNLELVYAVGCIVAGVYAGLGPVCPRLPQFEYVQSPKWKKGLLGYGGIKKPSPADVRNGAQYAVLEWARTQGYTGDLWDEADAMAIAAWARQDVQLER